jgi:formamidopyrimidine-DNA glycosylase
MPELAEVEFIRKQWNPGIGKKIVVAEVRSGKRLFRGVNVAALEKTLRGAKLTGSEAHGKQMAFRFSTAWLGIHLGMTGELRAEPASAELRKHDHLVLRLNGRNLIFNDPRQFGRVLFHRGKEEPAWWRNRPPGVLTPKFTRERVGQFLSRHGRAPVKAVLLSQNGFPGIGNWMADEILWQSKIHPARPASKLSPAEVKTLHTKIQSVSRTSMRTVGKNYGDLPKKWLFDHRWEAGGRCPVDGSALARGTVGGRTTCWCPSCQKRPVRV